MTRNEIQNKGINKWFDNNCVGAIVWATGVGKNYILTSKNGIIDRYFKSGKGDNALVILPSQDVKKRFTNELDKTLLNKCIVLTLSELQKNIDNYINKFYDLLIVDEIDIYTSEKRRVLLNNTVIRYKHVLGITATPFLIKSYYPELLKQIPIIHEIDTKDAKELGLIANFKETNIPLELSDDEYELYKEYSKIIRIGMDKFTKLYGLVPYLNYNIGKSNVPTTGFVAFKTIHNALKNGAILQLPNNRKPSWDNLKLPKHKTFVTSEYLIKLLSIVNRYNKNHIDIDELSSFSEENIKKFVYLLDDSFKKRTRLLQNNKAKYRAVVDLLNKIDGETIIFSESSEFSDLLYRYINYIKPNSALLYHSKAKVPKYPLRKWNNGKNKGKLICYSTKKLLEHNLKEMDKGVSILICVKALGRGFDRPSVKNVINTCHIKSKTMYNQKRGRSLRLYNDEKANIYNIYFLNTIEERNIRNNNN
jgi:superfamily II DNA or RNA helicase